MNICHSNEHINTPKQKLNRANGIVAKLKHTANQLTLSKQLIMHSLTQIYEVCMSNLGSES